MLTDEVLVYIFRNLDDASACSARLSCQRIRGIIDSTSTLPPFTLFMNPPTEGQILEESVNQLKSIVMSESRRAKISKIITSPDYHCRAMHGVFNHPFDIAQFTARALVPQPTVGGMCVHFRPGRQYNASSEIETDIIEQYSDCNVCSYFSHVSKVRTNICTFYCSECRPRPSPASNGIRIGPPFLSLDQLRLAVSVDVCPSLPALASLHLDFSCHPHTSCYPLAQYSNLTYLRLDNQSTAYALDFDLPVLPALKSLIVVNTLGRRYREEIVDSKRVITAWTKIVMQQPNLRTIGIYYFTTKFNRAHIAYLVTSCAAKGKIMTGIWIPNVQVWRLEEQALYQKECFACVRVEPDPDRFPEW